MADFDIKALTDNLEAGNGCGLKSALERSRFPEQEQVFDAIREEALGRPDNKLSFEKREVRIDKPNGDDTGLRIPVLDIRNSGNIIWEAFKPPGQDAVFGACKGKFVDQEQPEKK